MDTNLLKKALIRGIPIGLIIALAVVGVRTLIDKSSFIKNLTSVYGILTVICFIVAFVLSQYNSLKNKDK